MKHNALKKVIYLLFVVLFVVSTTTVSIQADTQPLYTQPTETEDLDPLVDISVTVTIKEIRAFDTIDIVTDPDFYVKVFINDNEYTSPIWYNQQYVKEPWEATCNVPDDEEWVQVKIQLFDWNLGLDKLCDISNYHQSLTDNYDVELQYNIKTGHWIGDDCTSPDNNMMDISGYGRLNGCDDNTIYEEDRDCEVLFDITQTDPDGDGIPYWTETNIYGTDPELDNTGEDADADGVPIEWEHKWGYELWYDYHEDTYGHYWFYYPFEWEDHKHLDPDNDGLDNVEEYLTSQWGSDPFRQDIFLELDQMEIGPNGEGNFIPENSKEMLRDAYAKHNIFFHIDDGSMGGGETYPFDESLSFDEIQEIYWEYFMHEDPDNWRRGVFHWGIISYHSDYYHGFAFPSFVENRSTALDCFHIATKEHEVIPFKYPILRIISRKSLNKQYHRELIYASAMMHETGHVLGIFYDNTPGCDNQTGKFPWEKDWWVWRNYKSCMNYGWMYTIVDYSDGSRGQNDFDDWGRIDLTAFQNEH